MLCKVQIDCIDTSGPKWFTRTKSSYAHTPSQYNSTRMLAGCWNEQTHCMTLLSRWHTQLNRVYDDDYTAGLGVCYPRPPTTTLDHILLCITQIHYKTAHSSLIVSCVNLDCEVLHLITALHCLALSKSVMCTWPRHCLTTYLSYTLYPCHQWPRVTLAQQSRCFLFVMSSLNKTMNPPTKQRNKNIQGSWVLDDSLKDSKLILQRYGVVEFYTE